MTASGSDPISLIDPLSEDTIEVPGGLVTREVFRGRKFSVFVSNMAPGQGESWHTHKHDVETVYYCIFGRGRITWRHEGQEKFVELNAGQLLRMDGGVENRIENVGNMPWMIVAIHDAGEGEGVLRLRY